MPSSYNLRKLAKPKSINPQAETNLQVQEKNPEDQSPPRNLNPSQTQLNRIRTRPLYPQKTDSEQLNDLYKNLAFVPAYSGNAQELVNTIETYSVHRPKRKKFKRRTTYVPGPYHTLQADLVDYKAYSRVNSGYKYILVVVDCFSRFCWTRPLKYKRALDTSAALDSIFETLPYYVPFFASDRGNEFLVRNQELRKILIEKHKFHVFTLSNHPKAAICERLNRTLKERLQRYFYDTGWDQFYQSVYKILYFSAL